MTSIGLKSVENLRAREAKALRHEIQQAHEVLHSCFYEMEEILSRPSLDAAALTSVRLKLAGIRLTRGPLVIRVAEILAGPVTEEEAAMLGQLRSSHQQLLQTATAHTARWSLDAIAADWPQYRDETRLLMRQWLTKAEREQRLVYPLILRLAELGE